jgi:hypothetical protein
MQAACAAGLLAGAAGYACGPARKKGSRSCSQTHPWRWWQQRGQGWPCRSCGALHQLLVYHALRCGRQQAAARGWLRRLGRAGAAGQGPAAAQVGGVGWGGASRSWATLVGGICSRCRLGGVRRGLKRWQAPATGPQPSRLQRGVQRRSQGSAVLQQAAAGSKRRVLLEDSAGSAAAPAAQPCPHSLSRRALALGSQRLPGARGPPGSLAHALRPGAAQQQAAAAGVGGGRSLDTRRAVSAAPAAPAAQPYAPLALHGGLQSALLRARPRWRGLHQTKGPFDAGRATCDACVKKGGLEVAGVGVGWVWVASGAWGG